MPNIVILATGGTIAGTGDSNIKAGYSSAQMGIGSIVDAVPAITDLANIKTEQIANVGSQDMTFDIMIRLSKRIDAILESGHVDGIVITHGTDTMEETAYFLNLTIKSKKPVVMTGAMRPWTALSADGPLNLYNAVAVAADPGTVDRGVIVVMNDRIHGAHSLTKNNTTSVETFLSPINGIMGTVIYGKTTYFRKPFRKHTWQSEFSVESSTALPRIDILYACADMPSDLIEGSVQRGARGIIIACAGNGNMNAATLKEASKMAKQGVYVVRSSRVPSGNVGRNVEMNDDDLALIASDELNPAKARILLMLACLKKRSLEEIQDLYLSY